MPPRQVPTYLSSASFRQTLFQQPRDSLVTNPYVFASRFINEIKFWNLFLDDQRTIKYHKEIQHKVSTLYKTISETLL